MVHKLARHCFSYTDTMLRTDRTFYQLFSTFREIHVTSHSCVNAGARRCSIKLPKSVACAAVDVPASCHQLNDFVSFKTRVPLLEFVSDKRIRMLWLTTVYSIINHSHSYKPSTMLLSSKMYFIKLIKLYCLSFYHNHPYCIPCRSHIILVILDR